MKTTLTIALSIGSIGLVVGLNGRILDSKARTPATPPQLPPPARSSIVGAQKGPGSVSMDNLLDAIEQVESGGNPNAIGDGGKAVGAYQIWKICVDDVNRILGYVEFSYQDRLDRARSREMCRIYLDHYGGTIEERARKWNGGPNGHKKQATVAYWNKVQSELAK